MLRSLFIYQVAYSFITDVSRQREETCPTTLSVIRSIRSRRCSSASTDKRHSSAAPDVTSMKLSTPKPTREMLPASIPAKTATIPSRLFHAMVKYSSRFPRRTNTWRSKASSTMSTRISAFEQHLHLGRKLLPATWTYNALCGQLMNGGCRERLPVKPCHDAARHPSYRPNVLLLHALY